MQNLDGIVFFLWITGGSSKEHRKTTVTEVLLLVLRYVGFNPITSAKNVWLVWLYQYNSGYNTNNTNNSGYIWLYDGIITYYIYIYIYVYIYIWLVVYLPLWKMMEWKSMGRMTSLYEMENNPVMFETTRDCIQCIRWCSHCIPQLKNPAMATWVTVFPEQLPSHLPNEQKIDMSRLSFTGRRRGFFGGWNLR